MQQKRRLADAVRERIRVAHYSYRTKQANFGWIGRAFSHQNDRHPRELPGPEVQAFLNHLATEATHCGLEAEPAPSPVRFLRLRTRQRFIMAFPGAFSA